MDVIERQDLALLLEPEVLLGRTAKADLLEQLQRRGYLFDTEADEEKAFDNLRAVYEKLLEMQNRRFTFVFNPTYTCNFACTYCFEPEEMHRTKSLMTPRQVDLCFEAAHAIIEKRTGEPWDQTTVPKTIELFGGEPFLPITRPALECVLSRAREEGFRVKVISNGYSLHRQRDLIERYRDVFEFFQITLDGPKRIHDSRRVLMNGKGTFDRIVQNIQMLIDLGIMVTGRMNVDGANIDAIPESLQYFKERGWFDSGKFYWDLAPVTDHPNSGTNSNLMREHQIVASIQEMYGAAEGTPTNFQMFRVLRHVVETLGLVKKTGDPFPSCHYCEANLFQFYSFGPDGLIYACPESINNPEMAIGRFDPELAIDEEKLHQWDRTIFTNAKCRECSVAMFCGGGCAYASRRTHPDTGLPVCDDAPEVLRTYVASIKDQLLATYCA
jgi:uncharacterized protein